MRDGPGAADRPGAGASPETRPGRDDRGGSGAPAFPAPPRTRRRYRFPPPAVLLLGPALVTAVLLPAPAWAAGSGAPLAVPVLAPANELTKFYVVKSPEENGGRVDELSGIAARTLGDADRFQEILVLNTGRTLPDGQLFLGAEQAVPGFALRLPADAEGQDVQFGVLPGENGAQPGTAAPPGSGTAPGVPRTTASAGSANPFASVGDRVPLPLLIGGTAGVAALTVAVIARRRLVRALRTAGRGLATAARALRPRLPRPLALALLRRRRGALARKLAADSRTPVLVRDALGELAHPSGGAPRVYSVRVEPSGLLASVSGTDRVPPPWTEVTPYRWRREGHPHAPGTGTGTGTGEQSREPVLPHLARVGVDADGAQIMVGLGQIRGALSVRGDLRVARDTVAALGQGLLELPWQNTVVVAVDPGADALPGLHGLVRIRSAAEVRERTPAAVFDAAEDLGLGLVRAAGGRGPIAGFLLVPRPPDPEEARLLAELASPRGNWTVLAAGDVPGAHWRWYAEPEGMVDLGVLDLRVTVPAPPEASVNRI